MFPYKSQFEHICKNNVCIMIKTIIICAKMNDDKWCVYIIKKRKEILYLGTVLLLIGKHKNELKELTEKKF